MKKATQRILALLLALAASVLVGCAAQSGPVAGPGLSYNELMAMMSQRVDDSLTDVMWVAADLPIFHEERLWRCGGLDDGPQGSGPQSDVLAPQLYLASCKPDGSDLVYTQLTLAPDEALVAIYEEAVDQYADGHLISSCTAVSQWFDDTGDLYLLLHEQINAWTESFSLVVLANQYTVGVLTADGSIQRLMPLVMPALPEGCDDFTFAYFMQCFSGENGTVWGWMDFYDHTNAFMPLVGGALVQFSLKDGSCQKQIPLPDGYALQDGIRLADGGLLLSVTTGSATGRRLFCMTDIDTDNADVQELGVINHVAFVKQPAPPAGDEAVLLFDTVNGIFTYDPATGGTQPALNWVDYPSIDPGSVFSVYALEDGRYMVFGNIFTGYAATGQYMQLLAPVDTAALDGLPTLTLAVMEGDTTEVRQLAANYNATGPDKYIRLEDYTDAAAAAAGFASGADMLQQAILNGTAPDIMLLPNGLDNNGLIRQGFFADMLPLLDADAVLSQEDLLPNLLAACSYNGTLPTLVPAFSVMTAVGAAELVGDEMNWTWEDFERLCAAYPSAVPFNTLWRDVLLLYLLQMGGDRFIDYETGTARLDTGDFARLLTTSAAWPADASAFGADPKAAAAAHEILLEPASLYDWRHVIMWEYEFNGDITFVGYPSTDGHGSALVPRMRVGISSYCTDVNAAWAFVRTLLLPDYQNGIKNALPARRDTLAAAAAAAMAEGEHEAPLPGYLQGQRYALEQSGEIAAWQRPLTAEEVNAILALIDSANVLYQYDDVVTGIIWEEAGYYYNGVRSAEDAAAIMQTRVQTYLDERA